MKSINNHVLERAKILCVSDRVKQRRLNHLYNIVHGTAQQYMFHNFTYVNQTYFHNTRQSHYNFMQPPVRGKEDALFGHNCFQLFKLHVWLRITDESLVLAMRIWSISLISSD